MILSFFLFHVTYRPVFLPLPPCFRSDSVTKRNGNFVLLSASFPFPYQSVTFCFVSVSFCLFFCFCPVFVPFPFSYCFRSVLVPFPFSLHFFRVLLPSHFRLFTLHFIPLHVCHVPVPFPIPLPSVLFSF